MQKLQDSVFSIIKTTNLSPAVFSFLQPTDDSIDKSPLGGILHNSRLGWLALGPKFCVVDIKTGLKVAARSFGTLSNNTSVTNVVELPTPLTENSQQLIISLECEDIGGLICIFHINGSQILRCIQTDTIVTELAVCDITPPGPFSCFDGAVMAGSKSGELFVFDLNRVSLMQALKDISQGYEHLLRSEDNPASITFLPLDALEEIDGQRHLALKSDDHLAILLNENSLVDRQYIFRNPDGTVRMKAKRDHVRVSALHYIPQLASLAVGFNFGAFQIWNLMTGDLEFTSQVNVECLPVTHFGFQEPCDDPRAFCYLWVVFSVTDRFEEEVFPLAVMYSLTYQGKRMLSDTKCLYQDFMTATIRFQMELSKMDNGANLVGGRCISCHTYSINSTLGEEGEDSMLNVCHLVWECWSENANSSGQHGMLLFDLDQWYKDQMPATYQLESNTFMSTWCGVMSEGACTLHVRLDPSSVIPYSHATRLEEHFYPNSLQYDVICLNTSESCVLGTVGIQRQIVMSMDEVGPTSLLNPTRLYHACITAGLTPLYSDTHVRNPNPEDQRRLLLSVALEARLSRFLKRCAHDWATGTHMGVGCTLPFLVDWCWKRAIELKQNAKELTAPLFSSSALPDRNVVRCLENCVQQLTQLTSLLDAILTKCCNLVVPDALSEMEERHKGVGTVAQYFQVVQWFLRAGLLPERAPGVRAPPYPADRLAPTYTTRRLKLHRLHDKTAHDDDAAPTACPLLYIDQLIDEEFGGERIKQMWMKGGSECNGLYPPPSLYSLLRVYLLPDVSEEHKHSLVLYLLLDYSMVYDEVRHEAVIRRLMQFPTMFGLSNTAIKATQAFWHLDHRDFDFALDQLQCLTGNTLSEWQHNVVLSSLLAQRKTQAALQYLHVRKPAPMQNFAREKDSSFGSASIQINDHDKLEDWQSSCNLYLARQLVFEALDVIRMCVQNTASLEDKKNVLIFFFEGCYSTGQLSKLLQVILLPFEEEVFIKYLENSKSPQTCELLIMYYLQQARYLEAQQYNNKLRQTRPRIKDLSMSVESMLETVDREGARELLVEVACAALPAITGKVANFVFSEKDMEPQCVLAPKPMSVFVQAKSPKNTFTYKSSFIQNTIENASETWISKPKMRRGLKRALNIEETPFICTPKIMKTRSALLSEETVGESSPSKRPRMDFNTPKTPKITSTIKVSEQLSEQMAALLDMPEESPETKLYNRSGAGTPHSILKVRRSEMIGREVSSPVDSRYLGDSDDEMLETASNHTNYSDSNKLLRFTIPTASETESTPSPPTAKVAVTSYSSVKETDISSSLIADKETSKYTTLSHTMDEDHPFSSPTKKFATEERVQPRKSFKDNVRARRSLSISVNSSLSDDPNTSIESIADIPITLINPRYSKDKRKAENVNVSKESNDVETDDAKYHYERMGESDMDNSLNTSDISPPKVPSGRRSIRSVSSEGIHPISKNTSVTPERQDSPIVTPSRPSRITRNRLMTPERSDSLVTPMLTVKSTRSRSRTPELSPRSSALTAIPEQPAQETASEPHPERSLLSVRTQRSRSRTPERIDKLIKESPTLEAITESPAKVAESPPDSPVRRSLRNRSRTPERVSEKVTVSPKLHFIEESPTTSVESPIKLNESPTKSTDSSLPSSPYSRRSLRNRSRTPERVDKPVMETTVSEPLAESHTLPVEPPMFTPSKRNLRSRSRTPERLVDKVSKETSKMTAISESPKQLTEVSTSPVRRNVRSRSRTPERVSEKAPLSPKLCFVVESPTKTVELPIDSTKLSESPIKSIETPTKSTDSSSPSSPSSRRSLRSRSRTPEPEKNTPSVPLVTPLMSDTTNRDHPQSPRRTPEKITSPALDRSTRHKKSLSRLVLEANTFAKVKKLEKAEPETQNLSDAGTEEPCAENTKSTPMKSLKHVASLMDITLSPIVNKSVLQSPVESVNNSEATEESNSKIEFQPMPSFTINETCIVGKSVLKSCETSLDNSPKVTEASEAATRIMEDITDTSKLEKKQLSAFTTINETFNKSVLDSYESSVAGTSHSSQKISISVSKENIINDPFDEISSVSCKSVLKDVSSLLTSDSDIEMRDTESEIERGKIAEIEMEINEIEDDMSECSDSDSSCNASDEEILIAEDLEEEQSDESDYSSEDKILDTDDTTSENEDEVISINDSDSNEPFVQKTIINKTKTIAETSSEDKNIGKAENASHSSNQKAKVGENTIGPKKVETENKTENVRKTIPDKNIERKSLSVPIEDAIDPLNDGGLSLMDNSELDIDNSIVDKEEPVVDKEDIKNADDAEEGQSRAVSDIEKISADRENIFDTGVNNRNLNLEKEPELQKPNENIEGPGIVGVDSKKQQATNTDKSELQVKTQSSDLTNQEQLVLNQDFLSRKIISTALEKNKVEAENKLLLQIEVPKLQMIDECTDKIEDTNKTKTLDETKNIENIPKTNITQSYLKTDEQVSDKPGTRTRKRSKSTSSNTSSKDIQDNESQLIDKKVEQPKTPMTRKRTKSIASNKSITEDNPETSESSQNMEPSPKTPGDVESRKIITRRVSRELTEKTEESKAADNSIFTTPKRRSSRSKSNGDDNASVTSDTSVKSSKSRMSEELIDVKAMPIRKGRKSIITTKPDLSVIPESTAEGNGSKGEDVDIVKEYSNTRRLTRHQKSVLENLLEPPVRPAPRSRRTSTASRSSAISEHSLEEDDTSSVTSVAYEDRIALLNKTEFDARMGRAASEIKSTVKAAAVVRSASIDTASPLTAGGDSSTRGRRASFNRACEALHTPTKGTPVKGTPTKGRRISTDVKRGDSESGESPASDVEAVATPRRSRRASVQSNTSQTSSTRSKKKSTLEEK